ncbi:type II secretion system protein GspL [Legionella bononiensis]|uniref:Type II secretion system protein L n=1 Tax=Legionella bononiensis TaxID=2793102 RepID=A0ABS1WD22_9GAMM|nr:type II secretion system protein GspL [Legionella bononiensis]MBL7479123.1 general secretion pathway protein GspL [Legionella bononiensis]MBL7527256.1 general secretion pathway protein GspL [Legionella bononiensis]MBL7562225.1 general secretion pathway protein GspL [Legionella bononiensis]
MDKCFLFTQHLDDNGCFCLKISSDGVLSAPPAQRNFAEIKSLQNECTTLVVETSASASILELELPWLPERKARVAIPFALEEKLAQPVEELHFAFDKLRYQNNQYIITVISKTRIQFIMNLLDENAIDYEGITLDWFALSSQELISTESTLLVYQDDFKGALSGELAQNYLKKHPLDQVLLFQDSQLNTEASITKNSDFSYTWIAQKLLNSKPLNLCQGEMQHGNTSDWIKKGYQLAGILCCVWLVSLLLVNAISLYSLNKQNKQLDDQIATIYHEFFPDAKQVISPKFRISQLLGDNNSNSQTRFWFLLNQFAKAMNENHNTIEDLRYQNKTLSVTLVSADFANLEQLENKLKTMQLKVKQTQASTRDQQVVATLELM